MNVHKRCQKNVANNCGINTRQMAQVLDQIGVLPGAAAKVIRVKITLDLTSRFLRNFKIIK